MQNPNGNLNPHGEPNNPYSGYNPYNARPNASQQAFGGAVTQDECNMAMLAHLLQLFCGFLGPLILYLIKKNESKFVAFHALQALVWQIGYGACMIVGVILTIVLTGLTGHAHGFPVFFIFFWLLAMAGAGLNLVLGILYTIKAYNGEWSSYPIIGQWVRRFL